MDRQVPEVTAVTIDRRTVQSLQPSRSNENPSGQIMSLIAIAGETLVFMIWLSQQAIRSLSFGRKLLDVCHSLKLLKILGLVVS